MKRILTFVACGLLSVCLVAGCASAPSPSQSVEETSNEVTADEDETVDNLTNEDSGSVEETTTNEFSVDSLLVDHVHDYTVTYKTIHHDAVTHIVTVKPVYAEQTTYHTVCNDCGMSIDGIANNHIESTGHSGYTTNVPITDTVLVSNGYSYEVEDEAAYDETVVDKIVCVVCGEELLSSEE